MNTKSLKTKLLEKFFAHQGINFKSLHGILEKLFNEQETLALSLMDSQSNMIVYSFSKLSVEMDILSESNYEIVKLILKNTQGELKDIIYYESEEFHLFTPIQLGEKRTFFLYFIGVKEKSNLILLRHKISQIENELKAMNVK